MLHKEKYEVPIKLQQKNGCNEVNFIVTSNIRTVLTVLGSEKGSKMMPCRMPQTSLFTEIPLGIRRNISGRNIVGLQTVLKRHKQGK